MSQKIDDRQMKADPAGYSEVKASNAWEHTKQAAADAADAAAGALEGAKQTVEPAAKTVKEKAVRAGQEAAHLVSEGWEKTKEAVAAVPEKTKEVYTDVKEHVLGRGHDTADTVRAAQTEAAMDRTDRVEQDLRERLGERPPGGTQAYSVERVERQNVSGGTASKAADEERTATKFYEMEIPPSEVGRPKHPVDERDLLKRENDMRTDPRVVGFQQATKEIAHDIHVGAIATMEDAKSRMGMGS